MAKYIGSPFGYITGELCGVVASKYRRIPYLRGYVKSQQPGTLKRLKQAIKGEIDKKELSVPQINMKLGVFGPLSLLARDNMRNLIDPVWTPQCRSENWTGSNLFMHVNAPLLYDSIPDKTKFISPRNMPDPGVLMITDGSLAPAAIRAAVLSPVHPEPVEGSSPINSSSITQLHNNSITHLCVSWNPATPGKGTPADNVHIFVLYWKLKFKNRLPDPDGWQNIKLLGSANLSAEALAKAGTPAKRSDTQAIFAIPTFPRTSRSTHFVVYLSFSNPKIGYSPSSSMNL